MADKSIIATNALAKAEQIQDIASMFNVKKMSKSAIAKKLDISVPQVNKALDDWNNYITDQAAKNPDVLDNYIENIYKFDEELAVLAKEAWSVVELADEHGAMATKLQALKLAKELTETKARMYQIMSPRMESGYMERMKRIERVNGILSGVIQNTISTCESCSATLWKNLEEAFRLMPDLDPDGDSSDEEVEDSETQVVEVLALASGPADDPEK